MMINPTMEAPQQRFLYTKSQIVYGIWGTHRTYKLYSYLDDEVLSKCGWTLQRFIHHRRSELPIQVIEVILAEVGMSWQELNARLQ